MVNPLFPLQPHTIVFSVSFMIPELTKGKCIFKCPGPIAKLVGASFLMPKCFGFDSQSGQILLGFGLIPSQGMYRRQPLSLSSSLLLSLSLSSSYSSSFSSYSSSSSFSPSSPSPSCSKSQQTYPQIRILKIHLNDKGSAKILSLLNNHGELNSEPNTYTIHLRGMHMYICDIMFPGV